MTKPKRGDCGTCHWFERVPQPPLDDQPWLGFCCVNPPTPFVGMQEVPGSRLSPHGPQAAPAIQGMLPPTNELRRCEKWWPFGKLPDVTFDPKLS